MNMSDQDMILLGKPWLSAMNPDINWAKDTLRLPATPRSIRLEQALQNKWGKLPLPGKPIAIPDPIRKKPTIEEEEDLEKFAPLHSPLPKNGKRTLERRKKEEVFHDAEEDLPFFSDPSHGRKPLFCYETKDDVWDDVPTNPTFALKVEDVATYQINDDKVLIEYTQDGSNITIFENLSFDTPLTRNGTSRTEIRRAAALSPLRNSWIFARKAEDDEYLKTSNKAQEFALKDAQEKKKKTFEELVPSYLHDFADVFAKDGLNQLPPSRPGVDHRIETKPGFIPKSAKTYPLSPKETEAVKAFLDEHLTKDFIQPSKSPQASGFFFVGKKD
jgi:hypothetical protein